MTDETPDEMTPTVTCSRCGSEWQLSHELEDRQAGNRAVEQFALDHFRHTGHYPDEVSPWVADCRRCPQGEQFLAERPARRFAETHTRHTDHTVDLEPPAGDDSERIGSPGEG